MFKLYNNINEISINFQIFFKSINTNLSKPNKKLLSFLIPAMVDSESVITADLSKAIKSSYFSPNEASNQKRIWRFMNNCHINMNDIYDSIIKHVISNISNVRHQKLIVTLDHMYTKNKFVTLMFTLKIDNQGIPLFFRSEKTLSNCHSDISRNSRKKLFSENFIKNSINYIIELLTPLNTKITFLADRWFFNLSILKFISDKGHYFCFRAKANSSVKVLVYDKKENHKIYKHINDLHSLKYHSVYYSNLEFGDMHFQCNLSISRSCANEDEEWYIVSNINPSQAIKTYSKRFGAIEMFFKSQKTNGFYLESTKTKNLHAFETLYGIACIASLWLNILALDYIKNHNHLKHKLNIQYNKRNKNGALIRILSSFKLGLTLFKKLYCSYINLSLKFNFKLYL